ncbi:fumarylacetoacetate hydrolase family protein [Alphaproteobacteria bacterium]|nr:fumarylacetoacetate hydrolase family protein [Alphaproteobacteria bacterium]NCF48705.1 FAA hydrolase family protein [Bacteroidota bacterium]
MTNYLFEPTAPSVIPIYGSDQLYPVNRVFCVGRNYEAHATEMGTVVDREAPFYFTKSPTAIILAEGDIAYAPRTDNYHYEMELVFALKSGGTNIAEADALSHIYGAAAGVDMTRRDHQNKAKETRRPWDTSKDVEQSAVVTPLRLMSDVPSVGEGRIHLEQNGTIKQEADLSQMVWSVPEIIADLSLMYTLQQGDVVFMGTPAGVGAVERGDVITGGVDGIADFSFKIA